MMKLRKTPPSIHRYRKPTRKTLSTLEYHQEQEKLFGGQFEEDNISVHHGFDDIPRPPLPSPGMTTKIGIELELLC